MEFSKVSHLKGRRETALYDVARRFNELIGQRFLRICYIVTIARSGALPRAPFAPSFPQESLAHKKPNDGIIAGSLIPARNTLSNKIICTQPARPVRLLLWSVEVAFSLHLRRDFRPYTEFIGFCRITWHHVSSNSDYSRDFRSFDWFYNTSCVEIFRIARKKISRRKWGRYFGFLSGYV